MNIIKRYSAPNKMDQCPKGTICIVNSVLKKDRELYQQINDDWENPVWQQIDDTPDIPS